MKARIRPAAPHDVPTLVGLIAALADYEKLTHLLEITPEKLHAQLFGRRPPAEVVMADIEVDGRPKSVGYALFFTNFSTFLCQPGIYLEDLFVLPEHRAGGIGRALLEHVGALAVERGCGRFEWSVLDWNTPAIRFYESMGATVMPEWRICRIAGDGLQRFAR
ncbi:GNAT family N-acetyltransferase [Aquabacterium sp. A7-Y]|uniref:GNAT family N-acetyltransferase n=1 Tax=Aquabacterium sp. A7-Y TaxID=1349605 RepID=UPI00223E07E4|nr:GNAT family N-acetyltransferase [Aquabacterium sp. A7-Y]MCW7537946.1 GNAT family N-acetyltransferase [Aquabacterium sp. A7-Y]